MARPNEHEPTAKLGHQGRTKDEGPNERQVRAQEILPGPVDRESK